MNIKKACCWIILLVLPFSNYGNQEVVRPLNDDRDKALAFMYGYFIYEHVKDHDEIYLAVGNYIDGSDLSAPAGCVLNDTQRMFPDKSVLPLPLLYLEDRAVFSGNGVVICLEVLAFGRDEKSKYMCAIILVHFVEGPMNAVGEAYQISFYDGNWYVNYLKRVYVS